MTHPLRCFQGRRPSFGLLLGVGLLLLILGSGRQSYGQSVALGARATTLGAGAEVTLGLSSAVNLRGNASYLPLTHVGTRSHEVDVQYTVEARLAAAMLLVDWYPFENAIRLSAGGVYNHSRIRGEARPTEGYTVRSKTISPERIGSLKGEVSFARTVSPYLGIGFGNSVRGSALDVTVDVGGLYVRRPHVQMEGRGLIADTANQEGSLNQGLQSFRVLPYLALGLSVAL